MKMGQLVGANKPGVTRRLKSRAGKAQSPPSRAEESVRAGGLRAFSARGFNRRGLAGLCLVIRQGSLRWLAITGARRFFGGPAETVSHRLAHGGGGGASHVEQPLDQAIRA